MYGDGSDSGSSGLGGSGLNYNYYTNEKGVYNMYNVWVPTNCEKILQNQEQPERAGRVIKLAAARNEYESGQVILKAEASALNNVSVSVSDLTCEGNVIPSSEIKAYKQHYIHITEPTTEYFKEGWYPDALIPLTGQNSTFDVEQGKNQGLWFTVKVPKGISAGLYNGNVQITGNGIAENIPVELKVWDFDLTDESHCKTNFTIWPNELLKGHPGIQEGSEEYVKLFENYYNFMLDYRITPMDLPIDIKCNVMDEGNLDLDAYVAKVKKILQDPRITSYRIPFFYNQDQPNLAKTKELYDELKANGLIDKGFFYLGEIDEPSSDNYNLVKQRCNEIKSIDTNVMNLVTVAYCSELAGYVNTWCGLLPSFTDLTPQDVKRIQNTGDHAWWYTCVDPKSPYPSYHIDDNMVGARVLSWMQKYYNIEGSIYWAVNIFDKYDLKQAKYVPRDVWTDPKAYPGANGDGYLMYPGTKLGIDGPVGTIRMEAIRDGAEDYEYLWLLEERMNEAAKVLGIEQEFKVEDALKPYYDRLFTNVKSYETDPEKLLQVRREVAEEIENIGNNPKTLVTLGQSAENGTQLTIYTEPNATVKVNGYPQTGEALGNNAQKVSMELNCQGGINTVNIEVRKDSNTRNITKVFKVDSKLYPVELNYCETQGDIDKWKTRDVDLSLSDSNATEGGYSMQATYKTTDDFPGIRLSTDNGGLFMSDWTKCKKLEFDIYNPDESQTADMNIKLFDKTGTAFDNPCISIAAPKTSYHVSIPISEISGINLSNMWMIELWMKKCSRPVTLYFDKFCLLSDQQNQ